MSTSKKKRGPNFGKKLSERQKRFCEEYVVNCVSQAEALRRAGYSERANQRILENPLATAYIEKLRRERADRLGLRADAALLELARMAFVNVADLHNDDWSLKRKEELTEDQQRAIVGIKRKSTTSVLSVPGGDDETSVVSDVELKTAKADKLTEVLKHFGLIKEHVEHTGTLSLADLVPKRKPRP